MKIIISCCALFICSLSILAQKTIVVNEHIPQGTKDITPIVRNILEKNTNENIVLEFQKGEYHFYADKAFGKYHSVTNHDNSYKYFAFPIIDRQSIQIKGNNSEFIFHGIITPFLIENSENVKIQDLSIDWAQPFYLQAEVVASDAKAKTIDLKVDTNTAKAVLSGQHLAFETNGQFLYTLGETMLWDSEKKAVAHRAQEYLLNSKTSLQTKTTQVSPDTYRIIGGFKKQAAVGQVYVFKGPNKYNRMCQAFHLISSKDVILESINIYHAGGMGVIGEKTENIHLNKVNVKLREGTDRMVSTTADATHFCNCKGSLIIENCLFENMLDDATNIHGTYIKISEIIDEYTVHAGVKHHQQYDYNFAEAGDNIELVHFETLLPMAKNTIKSFRKINHHLFEVKFENKIPDSLKVNDAIDNITWYPTSIFRNNVVRNNRARSILISARYKTQIENNTFSSMMTSILFEGDLDHWFESGSVTDVVVRNNIFYDNVYGGNRGSVIWINPHNKVPVKGRPYERNIRIENNEFRTFDNPILHAYSVDGLIFNNNKIVETNTYPKIQGDKAHIDIKNSQNIEIKGNTFEGKEPAVIKIDAESKETLKIDRRQKGFQKLKKK